MGKKVTPSLHELLVVEIMRTSELIQHRLAQLFRDYGLTNPQYNILRILRGAQGLVSVGQIKERMLFETSDVSRLLDRLVKKGLVDRNICPDNRRKMDISISKIGLQVLEKLDLEVAQKLSYFYKEQIADEKAEATLAVLKSIVSYDEQDT